MMKFFLGIVCTGMALTISAEKTPSAASMAALTKKVADWQIETFEESGKYRALPSQQKCTNWSEERLWLQEISPPQTDRLIQG